jgi:hypothetical protein
MRFLNKNRSKMKKNNVVKTITDHAGLFIAGTAFCLLCSVSALDKMHTPRSAQLGLAKRVTSLDDGLAQAMGRSKLFTIYSDYQWMGTGEDVVADCIREMNEDRDK